MWIKLYLNAFSKTRRKTSAWEKKIKDYTLFFLPRTEYENPLPIFTSLSPRKKLFLCFVLTTVITLSKNVSCDVRRCNNSRGFISSWNNIKNLIYIIFFFIPPCYPRLRLLLRIYFSAIIWHPFIQLVSNKARWRKILSISVNWTRLLMSLMSCLGK